eukprot:728688-Prorocentrum_minimum.AAC.2
MTRSDPVCFFPRGQPRGGRGGGRGGGGERVRGAQGADAARAGAAPQAHQVGAWRQGVERGPRRAAPT